MDKLLRRCERARIEVPVNPKDVANVVIRDGDTRVVSFNGGDDVVRGILWLFGVLEDTFHYIFGAIDSTVAS
jgi:hypothetical protein